MDEFLKDSNDRGQPELMYSDSDHESDGIFSFHSIQILMKLKCLKECLKELKIKVKARKSQCLILKVTI